MRIRMASADMAQLLALAAASPDREICGLLFGTETRIAGFLPAENVADDPAHRFEIDPAVLIAAHRRARSGGAAIIGHYHSHPAGPAMPSAADADAASADRRLWLIIGAGDARLYRERLGGPIRRMFDAVPLRLVPADA